jgi:hypothetical protein
MCKFLSIWPLVRFKYIALLCFVFVSFIYLFSIDRPYITIHFANPIKGSLYTKFTEQHDHNMQLKRKENKIVKIKMKNKNTCASALSKFSRINFALWRQIKRPQRHIYGGCATLCANELGPPSLRMESCQLLSTTVQDAIIYHLLVLYINPNWCKLIAHLLLNTIQCGKSLWIWILKEFHRDYILWWKVSLTKKFKIWEILLFL